MPGDVLTRHRAREFDDERATAMLSTVFGALSELAEETDEVPFSDEQRGWRHHSLKSTSGEAEDLPPDIVRADEGSLGRSRC